MATVVLLGPQRLQPIVTEVVDDLEIDGKIATITAGWQEREAEDDELAEHLGGRTLNLELYRRAERVFAADADLAAVYRARQKLLREHQELYRVRLAHALDAIRELLARAGSEALIRRERDAAFAALRRLDREHMEHLREIHTRFAAELALAERPGVLREREELAALVEGASAVAVAGGHVMVLLNRMRMFGIFGRRRAAAGEASAGESGASVATGGAPSRGSHGGLAGSRPVLAWSAGAMALGERLVVFHDSPPQGAGNAELLEQGLGVYRGLVAFPHARKRLRLGDRQRVELLSRRFAPRCCLLLDEGDRLDWNGSLWSSPTTVRTLADDGSVVSHRDGEEMDLGAA